MGVLIARLVKLIGIWAAVVLLLNCDAGKFAGPYVTDPDSDENRWSKARPVDLYLESGSGQSGIGGHPLEDSIVVRAADRRGDPISGIPVRFAVSAGGGSVEPAMGVTDAAGRSARSWTLGMEGSQEVTASIVTDQWRVGKDSVVVVTATLTLPGEEEEGDEAEEATLTGLEVQPSEVTLAPEANQQFVAVGRWSDGSEEIVPVAWTATGGAVDDEGLFTAAAQAGNFRVIGQHQDGHADTALVSIVETASQVAQVVVSPATDTLVALGATRTFQARALDADGAEVPGVAFVWTSSATEVATVDQVGKLTARAVGSVLVFAAAAGLADTAQVTVRQDPASIEMEPSSMTLNVGETATLRAVVRDAGGNLIPGSQPAWSSSDAGVASYADGVVTARSAGDATITATSGSISASASVLVSSPPVPSSNGQGIWLSAAEIAALPTSGAAWDNVKRAADTDLRGGALTVRDDHNTRVMAAALVAARLDSDQYRARVRDALLDVMAAPLDGDGLAANRRLGTYAIAADLIGLNRFDPQTEAAFRAWLVVGRDYNYTSGGGGTIIGYHERRPNNYGTHAGASRMAVALYLDDRADFEKAVRVFRGWLGDRSAYADFQYRDDFSWHQDANKPVGINPRGATKHDGSQLRSIDGVIPDDQRRCGSFQWPPCTTNYTWEALQGAVAMAWIAHRQGHDAFNWSDQALLRAARWLYDRASFPAVGDDVWQLHIFNRMYGPTFNASNTTQPGKNIGWTEWTHR